jgi:predicted outer membrane repeat protein
MPRIIQRLRGSLVVGALLLCGTLLPAAEPSRAQGPATLYVAPGGNNANSCLALAAPCATIDAAIRKAASGATILIAPGDYRGSVRIDRNLALIGAGADTTSTDGERDGSALIVGSGVQASISGLTIQGGLSNQGAGISNSGALTLTDSVVADNIIPGYSGRGDGAGIYNAGALVVISTTLTDNRILSPTIGFGAGIYNAGGLRLVESTLVSNSAGVEGSVGGAIFNSGPSVRIEDSTIQGNQAQRGAGIYNTGGILLVRSTINGNLATAAGIGSIAVNTGSLTIVSSVMDNNSGSTAGSILNTGTLSVARSTFLRNQALNGGAIYGGGTITIDDSTFANNQATANDGGALFFSTGSMTVTNSTFFENRAAEQGGAIVTGFGQNPNVTIVNSTFNGNTALGGNNVRKFGGRVSASNSIFADNSSVGSCYDLTSAGNNLSSDATCVGGPGDIANAIPLLGPLQDYGGGALTMLPLEGSPARDAGNDATCAPRDQRGVARPNGFACDIGAVEAPAPPPPAQQLAIIGQPFSARAGETLTVPVVVSALDARGQPASSFNGPVTISLGGAGLQGEAGASQAPELGGTLVVTASAGIATFGDLTISQPGDYVLVAESPGLFAATTSITITPQQAGLPSAIPELESNDVYTVANPLGLDPDGFALRSGVISDALDIDVFVFEATAGSTITLQLSSLPADYDLLLVADPTTGGAADDSLDLNGIADFGGVPRSFGGVPRSFGGVPRSFGGAFKSGSADDSFTGYLPYEGRYYLAVYSPGGEFDASRSYQLSATLAAGSLASPTVLASEVPGLNLTADPTITTLYIFHEDRMSARYPGDAGGLSALATTLAGGPLLAASRGATLDLGPSAGLLQPADRANLDQLYAEWDRDPRQPLVANEVARKIRLIIDRAIRSFYPNVSDIVLVGGDAIIPFYRIPDENDVAPERDYYALLKDSGAFGAGEGSALAGSLFFNFLKTDNYYADRRPTPFRGREFALPDLALGRLVERPSEIVAYLDTYADGNFVIDASKPGAPGAGGVLVTAYDFATDQGEELARLFDAYGFSSAGTLGDSPTLSTLISDDWGVDEYNNIWFSGQLPQLGADYTAGNRYHLAALNGHFTHFSSIPAAVGSGVISATRLLTPTAALGAPPFFRVSGSPALIYSVGCQGGFSADDEAFGAGSPFAADWPQAVMRQGGNWISNSGFGYGDLDVVGYSERLSVLFTQAIGRDLPVGGPYAGAPLGASLALAKRQYLQELGSGTLDPIHEKVLSTMTLYGLPFLTVKVPSPQEVQTLARPAKLAGSPATFSRIITFTNSFSISAYDNGSVPQVTTSTVEDSLRPGQSIQLAGIDQVAVGRPVLPRVIYDVSVGDDPASAPKAIGVRLLDATTLDDLTNFRPKVTNVVTDDTYAQQADGADLGALDVWSPELPFALLSIPDLASGAAEPRDTDQLIISPAQFRALSGRSGTLRRFSQLVFEVTYVDPAAPEGIVDDLSPPLIVDVDASLPGTQGAPPDGVRLTALVEDGESGVESVTALYSVDGRAWQQVALALQPNGSYAATITIGASGRLELLVDARDRSGNVSVETGKGEFTPFSVARIALLTRQDAPVQPSGPPPPAPPAGKPDLVAQLGIVPNQQEFIAGRPVTLVVTVTNQGQEPSGEFWVDLYVQPISPPNAANQLWSDRCLLSPCVGLAWKVPAGLAAGSSVVLSSNAGLASEQSRWPGWLPAGTREIYAYVDSFNPGVSYGGVDEANELNNRAARLELRVRGPNPVVSQREIAERR